MIFHVISCIISQYEKQDTSKFVENEKLKLKADKIIKISESIEKKNFKKLIKVMSLNLQEKEKLIKVCLLEFVRNLQIELQVL